MRRQRTIREHAHQRRGMLVPLVAVILVVVLAAVALVFDRLWLQAAHVELQTAAEAAALAAAARLADDDRLRASADARKLIEHAISAGERAAAANRVAGEPVHVSASDLTFGKLIADDSGRERFVHTDDWPTTALVTAERSRHRHNPVALFLAGLTNQPYGDVLARAEASIDNRVVAVRPYRRIPAPVLPIAILHRAADPAGTIVTWETEIEAQRGADVFRSQPASRRVVADADEIPEITLGQSVRPGDHASPLLLAELGAKADAATIADQIRGGWRFDPADAERELRVGAPLPVNTELPAGIAEAFRDIIGLPRIVALLELDEATEVTNAATARISGLAAIRVLDVIPEDGHLRLVVQPAVIATRSAVVDRQLPAAETNPYIFRLSLTH